MLSKEEVIKIAKLARLELSEAEIEKYQKELSAILDYAKQLDEINTDNVEPLYQVTGLEHVVRKDQALPQNNEKMNQILKASKQGEQDHQFLVKNVF